MLIKCFIHHGLKACRVTAEKYRDDTVRSPRQAQAKVMQRTTTSRKVSGQKVARDGVGGTGQDELAVEKQLATATAV